MQGKLNYQYQNIRKSYTKHNIYIYMYTGIHDAHDEYYVGKLKGKENYTNIIKT